MRPCGWTESSIWLGPLLGPSAPRRLLKIYGIYIFPMLQLRLKVVGSYMNVFSRNSGNLCATLVYYLEVADVGSEMVVGHTLLVTCTGDVTVVFFNSIIQTSARLSYVGKVTIFFWTGPFVDNVCLRCDGILSFWCIRRDLRVLVPLKITCTLVFQKILLNSSLRPETYRTEMKIFLLTSKPVSAFMVGVVGFFAKSLMFQSG